MIRYTASEERVSPDLIGGIIACSKTGYKKCARCGSVSEAHFVREGLQDRADKDRAARQHAFFSKRAKRAPPEAQLRLWREDYA